MYIFSLRIFLTIVLFLLNNNLSFYFDFLIKHIKFVDSIIVLFDKLKHLKQFAACINKQHPNIRFSAEVERNDALHFLDIKI